MIDFEDGYGMCECGREGKLEGWCDVDTTLANDGGPRRLVERWQCEFCGAKWDEVWTYSGQDAV